MLLDTMGLTPRMEHKPNQMSGGENQRTAICVALANNPELLLGDEITGELDSETTQMVMDALKMSNKEFGTTVINVTHNDHQLSPELYQKVKDGFSLKIQPDGARYLMPIRVDLLCKPNQKRNPSAPRPRP